GPIGLPSFGTDAIEALSAKIKATFPYICHTKFEPREESIVQVISSCKNFKINNRTNRQQTPNSLVLELTKDSDTLFAEMHPKTRYNIKVAQKHGLECWEDHNPAMVNLLYETGSRQGFKTHEQGYYEKMVKFFNKGNITTKLLCVGKNNVPYALGLFLDYDNIRTYLFGGSDYEYRKYMAPYLLHWQAVGDAKAQGFQTYDFWGLTNIHGKEVGFTRFKQGFGGKLLNFPNAIDVIYNPAKYKLFQLVRTIRSLI
ncbi:MAG TPA: peptidoglycan bridge formation glycyltransferase FemA/FemB family protein, partial [Patescibacteria group bacterium]|nr:peptidoglycan bridge formation glycyltransferase FemA/FemB family protein [Patescibacteria group bacterium]